jgi:ureidoglycolate dehydrogenase (NAD+)
MKLAQDIIVAAADLEHMVGAMFLAAGLPAQWAQREAEVLIWADLRGVGSHGVLRVPSYIAGMKHGMRRGDADIRTIFEKGALAIIEADRGPGLHAMRLAMDKAIALSQTHAIGWVALRNATHTGPMGFYVRQAADQDLIGIAMSASRPLMAYYGTRTAAAGTAPLAIGVPCLGGKAMVLDMANAAITIGNLAQARMSGKTLPKDVALDAQGRMTTDPARAVTPMPVAGPKGAGLALMIECLASLMSGSPLLTTAFDEPALRNQHLQNGVCIAVDPTLFLGPDVMAGEVDRLARGVKAEPMAEGFDEILMPGERGDREASHRREHGIPLPVELWNELVTAAKRLGVQPAESALTAGG